MKKRLVSLDMAKGIGILSVLIVHCLALVPARTAVIYLLGSLMLIFFFITGYNYRPGKRSVSQNIKQRAKQILIPFYLYSVGIMIISSVIYISMGEMTLQEAFKDSIGFFCGIMPTGSVFRYIFMPYWFLPIMFLSSVLFFFIADFSLKSAKRTLLISLLLMAISVPILGYTNDAPWRWPLIPVCSAIMLMGAYAGQKQFFANPPFKGVKLGLSVLCAAIISVVLTIIFGSSYTISRGQLGSFGGWSVFSAVVICLVQIYMLVFGCELMSKAELVQKVFSWFGVYSMQILVAHMFVAIIVSRFTGWPCGFVLMSQREEIEGIAQAFQTTALYFVTIGLLVCWLLIWGKIKESAKKGR